MVWVVVAESVGLVRLQLPKRAKNTSVWVGSFPTDGVKVKLMVSNRNGGV